MKVALTAIALAASLLAPADVSAQTADDVKWINECIRDNRDQGAKAEVVRIYCTCMNNKMSDNETRSISQWEKVNPKARAACDKEAGWK
jgi:hypothetical protein